MTNLEILVAGVVVTLVASIGVLFRTLGCDEIKHRKPFEVDADLGAIHKYEK